MQEIFIHYCPATFSTMKFEISYFFANGRFM